MRRIRLGFVLLTLPFLFGCDEGPTPSEPGAAVPSFANGRNKPPKDPPSGGGDTADPAIAFVHDGTLRVMNADGSMNTAVVSGVSRGISWSPDGTRLAYGPGGGGSISTIRIAELALVAGVPSVTATTDLVLPHPSAPVWSPLGDLIAYGGSCDPGEPDGTCGTWGFGNHLRVVSAAGGPAHTLYEAPGCTDPWDCRIGVPTWSPSGDRLAFVEGRGPGRLESLRYINVADAPTTVSHTLISPGALASICTPDWSPDGSRIAFWGHETANSPTTLFVFELASGTWTNVRLEATAGCAEVSWSPDGTRWVVDTGTAIRLVDVATGQVIPRQKSKLAWGVGPDWRPCEAGDGCGLTP